MERDLEACDREAMRQKRANGGVGGCDFRQCPQSAPPRARSELEEDSFGRKVPQGELVDFGGFWLWSFDWKIAGILTTLAGLADGASMACRLSRSADESTEFHHCSVDGAVMWGC